MELTIVDPSNADIQAVDEANDPNASSGHRLEPVGVELGLSCEEKGSRRSVVCRKEEDRQSWLTSLDSGSSESEDNLPNDHQREGRDLSTDSSQGLADEDED